MYKKAGLTFKTIINFMKKRIWKGGHIKVIVTVFSSWCLLIGFGVLIINYIWNFLM